MRRSRRPLLSAVAALVLVASAISGAAATNEPTPAEIAKAAADRAQFGLPADAATVRYVLISGLDVGTARLGIPMTAREEARLDLPGRMAFADAVTERVLPFVQALPTYGGVYFDQIHGGGLVVLLTERDPKIEATITGMMPAPSLGLTFTSANYTEAQLVKAWRGAWEVWRSVVPNVEPLRVGVDTINNRVVFIVAADDLLTASAMLPVAQQAFDVAVSVEAGEPDFDAACTSRDDCANPMMAGIRIYKGVIDTYPECTMGFHVAIGTDESFVTAGHCSYNDSREWLHPAVGRVGSDLYTLLGPEGQDIELVSMYDAQRSDDIYRPGITYGSDDIISMTTPSVGMAVVTSLGYTNKNITGTVTSIWTSWYTSAGNFKVWGGDTSFSEIVPGNSGSPIYHLVGSGSQARAIGVLDTRGGLFARLDTSLWRWGAVVFLG